MAKRNEPAPQAAAQNTTQETAPQAAAQAPASKGRAYVFSTLATDQKYVNWQKGGGDIHISGHSVLVKGGTGVVGAKNLVTPLGVATEIGEDDIGFLESNPLFKLHAKNGYVTIQRRKADPERVAADMNLKDPSAPRTQAHYANAGEGEAKPRLKE